MTKSYQKNGSKNNNKIIEALPKKATKKMIVVLQKPWKKKIVCIIIMVKGRECIGGSI